MFFDFFFPANSGAAAGGILFFVTYIPYFFLQPRYQTLTWAQKILSSLIFNVGMAYGGQIIGMYEGTGELTLKLPITTIVICFVICLWFLKVIFANSVDRSDCFSQGRTVCLYAKIGLKSLQKYSTDDINRLASFGQLGLISDPHINVHKSQIRLTLKAPRKSASENVVCLCRLLHLLANFSNLHFAYRQTAWTWIRLLLKEQSDLGPHCLQ